jgi:DNA polymerase III subunit epsilon
MKVLVFDTETTGLPTERNPSIYETHKWPHIIQLSYIIYDITNNSVVIIVNDYINIDDNIEISKESQKIHNISREMLNDGIQIREALYKLNNYVLNTDLIIGHNVSFDKRMVIVEGIRNKIKMNITNTYCTMQNSTQICKIEKKNSKGELYFKYPSLSELNYNLFRRVPTNTHNALIDVLVCLRCYCKIKENIDIFKICKELRLLLNV